jgi:xanthine dehydrogenase YagS FAD-binding subunit
MKPFTYERAADVRAALAKVASEPGAAVLAGGTNLVDHLRLGFVQGHRMQISITSGDDPKVAPDAPSGTVTVATGQGTSYVVVPVLAR